MGKFKISTYASNSSTSSFDNKSKQARIPKAEKCIKKLAKAKQRRLKKYGDVPVMSMSSTTRSLFKKWGHRAEEIRTWISQRISAKLST